MICILDNSVHWGWGQLWHTKAIWSPGIGDREKSISESKMENGKRVPRMYAEDVGHLDNIIRDIKKLRTL